MKEIQEIVQLFTGFQQSMRDDEAQLKLIYVLITDPTAWPDLVNLLSAGNHWDTSTHAGNLSILKVLHAHGIVEACRDETGEIKRLRFCARPLICMLRRMPHRDPATGLSKH